MKNNMMINGVLCAALSAVGVLVAMEDAAFKGTIIPVCYDRRMSLQSGKLSKDYNLLAESGNGHFNLVNSKACGGYETVVFCSDDREKQVLMIEMVKNQLPTNKDVGGVVIRAYRHAIFHERNFFERTDPFFLRLQRDGQEKICLIKGFRYNDPCEHIWKDHKYSSLRIIDKIIETAPLTHCSNASAYTIIPTAVRLEYQKSCFDEGTGESSTEDAALYIPINSVQYDRLKFLAQKAIDEKTDDPCYLFVTDFFARKKMKWLSLNGLKQAMPVKVAVSDGGEGVASTSRSQEEDGGSDEEFLLRLEDIMDDLFSELEDGKSNGSKKGPGAVCVLQ